MLRLSALLAVSFAPPQGEASGAVEEPVSRHERERAEDEDGEFANNVSIKPAYAAQFLGARTSKEPEAGEAGELDHLGGFILSYERIFVPELFGIEVAKPFYFSPGRFDSPIEFNAKLFHRWGRIEPFLALGGTFNIRIFYAEREEIEGRTNRLSFGLTSAAGLAVWVARRWAVEVEVSYAYVPTSDIVQHELGAAVGPVFAF